MKLNDLQELPFALTPHFCYISTPIHYCKMRDYKKEIIEFINHRAVEHAFRKGYIAISPYLNFYESIPNEEELDKAKQQLLQQCDFVLFALNEDLQQFDNIDIIKYDLSIARDMKIALCMEKSLHKIKIEL